jgi:hypothetical protein
MSGRATSSTVKAADLYSKAKGLTEYDLLRLECIKITVVTAALNNAFNSVMLSNNGNAYQPNLHRSITRREIYETKHMAIYLYRAIEVAESIGDVIAIWR